MTKREIVVFLNEIRIKNGMTYEEIAQRTGRQRRTVIRFFEGGKAAQASETAVSVARALGLATDRYDSCEAMLIAYWKEENRLSAEERRLVERFRRLDERTRGNLVLVAETLAKQEEAAPPRP